MGKVGIGETDFGSHEDARNACKTALADWFDLFDEVELTSNQLTDKPLKVDLLAISKEEFGYILGIEIKPRFYRMAEYSQALKQAIDYRLGTIEDGRLSEFRGRRVSGGFVFPRWHGGHDKEREYREQALGMEILCHHFRVGSAHYCDGAVTLMMNDKRLWSSGIWSGNAEGVLGGKERIGSQKVIDPARIRSQS